MRLATLTFRFTLFSLMLVLLAAFSIGYLIRQHEIRQLSIQVEDRNVIMAHVFMNLLSSDLQVLLESPVRPADDPSIATLSAKIANIIHDSEIAKLKLYNSRGQVVFSTDLGQLGEDKSQNPGFQSAFNGYPFSELTHRHRFSASERELLNVDLVASYIPIQQQGQVIAVFELYQDVTPLLGSMQATLWQTFAIVLCILAAMYGLQILVIRQVHNVIRVQEEALERANYTLDQRVTQRTSELEQSKRRISELLAEQQLIFDNAQVGILLLQNRKIVKGNQRIADMFGYETPEDFEGQSTEIFYCSHADFLAAGQIGYSQLADQGYAGFEVQMHRRDGVDFWVIQSGRPLNPQDVLNSPSIWVYTDMTERKMAEEKIRLLAFYDQLTELPNRTLLMDRLKQALVASERNNRHGALLFLDLDHFKSLNDTLGHDQGDLLLKQVARLLSANVRQGDTVARLGGDEFVILLLDLDEDVYAAAKDVELTCRKLLVMLKQNYSLSSNVFHCSASIGCTLFQGKRSAIEELLKQADLAMYRSKEAGRNTFHFFDPAMEASVLARTRIEADLRQAIQETQFFLHFQPQVEGTTGHITGAEALIRWQHPMRGLIPPNDFIHSAEEIGLIVPIGHWVMQEACRQLASWASDPLTEHLNLAVNVSAQQFSQANFVEQVITLLERTGANPQRLKLELTESLFAQNIDDIIGKMSTLKAVGVSFSLDDFGTGYSSLSYLSRLPLDQLKIDRSFVMDIGSHDNNIAICAATISLAHSLGLRVVAEGVETEAQRYFLSTVHRCDYLQGYLISKPLSVADLETLVRGTAA